MSHGICDCRHEVTLGAPLFFVMFELSIDCRMLSAMQAVQAAVDARSICEDSEVNAGQTLVAAACSPTAPFKVACLSLVSYAHLNVCLFLETAFRHHDGSRQVACGLQGRSLADACILPRQAPGHSSHPFPCYRLCPVQASHHGAQEQWSHPAKALPVLNTTPCVQDQQQLAKQASKYGMVVTELRVSRVLW
jgi:hypothetical protein